MRNRGFPFSFPRLKHVLLMCTDEDERTVSTKTHKFVRLVSEQLADVFDIWFVLTRVFEIPSMVDRP